MRKKKTISIAIMSLAATTAPYVATHAQDSLLEIVGVSILPAGANARAVYYLLHGIWMEPIVVAGDRQLAEKTTLAKAATLLLIPNPANDEVTVRLPGANGTLQIFDLVGKLQRMINLNSTDTELDTATLTNGIYLLHYTAPDGNHAQARLVIQH